MKVELTRRSVLGGLVTVGAGLLPGLPGCSKPNHQQVENRGETDDPSGVVRERLVASTIPAHFYNSGFPYADDNYNACFWASNKKVYYVLCSGSVEIGAQMYSFDPATGRIDHIADLTAAVGEEGLHAVAQGKGHSVFIENNGKLYFSTHLGYYGPTTSIGQQLEGWTPPGYKPYPGGHFVSYDLTTGKFESLAKAPVHEGIISFAMDPGRGRLYGITSPSGLFLRYDMHTHSLKNLGPTALGGQKGIPGRTFRVLCRALVVDPGDGSVYFTTADGKIFAYRLDADAIRQVPGPTLKKDVFGSLNPADPETMGYNWRQAFWYAPQRVIYAVHGRSGNLFTFTPGTSKVEVLDRFVSVSTRTSGMYDAFKFGHLGFAPDADLRSIYYLTGTPPVSSAGVQAAEKFSYGLRSNPLIGKPTAEAIQKEIDRAAPPDEDENIHFVTYDIASGRTIDYGALQLKDGRRPFFAQSIAIGSQNIYTVTKVRDSQGHVRVDLLSFQDPASRQM